MYALALVCWEILTRGVVWSGLSSPQIAQCVLRDERPELPYYTPPLYRSELLQPAWASNLKLRPTPKEIIAVLDRFEPLVPTWEAAMNVEEKVITSMKSAPSSTDMTSLSEHDSDKSETAPLSPLHPSRDSFMPSTFTRDASTISGSRFCDLVSNDSLFSAFRQHLLTEVGAYAALQLDLYRHVKWWLRVLFQNAEQWRHVGVAIVQHYFASHERMHQLFTSAVRGEDESRISTPLLDPYYLIAVQCSQKRSHRSSRLQQERRSFTWIRLTTF